MKKKKLIVWQAHESNLSGANIALLEYINALINYYRFHVILPHDGNMRHALEDFGVEVTIVPQYGWTSTIPQKAILRRIKRWLRTRIAIKSVKKILNNEKTAMVFTNTLVPFVAARVAYELSLPHVWWIHEFGEEDFGFTIGNGSPIWAYKMMQQWSKLVICNSDAVALKFKTLLPEVLIERVYQPVTWRGGGKKNLNNKAVRYLMFGQISPCKGHLEVLEAVALTAMSGKEILLHIKGPADDVVYLERLYQYVHAHGLTEQVMIETGFFIKEEVMPNYDILIVASRSEAFGRVIVEANKAGLRVVVKNKGGAPELINNTNGLLYETVEDLCAILSCEKDIPAARILLNYDENAELQYLHKVLSKIS